MMVRRLPVWLLPFLLSAAIAAPPGPVEHPRAREALEQASRYMDDGAYDLAVDRLHRALSHERHPDLHVMLGRCFRALERRELAYYAYRHAWELEPGNGEALASLADLSLEFGSLAETEALLPALRRFHPAAARTAETSLLLARGERALEEQKFRTAKRYFRRAADVGGEDDRTEAGTRQALKGLADRYRALDRPRAEMEALLRLYHLRASRKLGARIEALFARDAKDLADLRDQILPLLEHARSLPE